MTLVSLTVVRLRCRRHRRHIQVYDGVGGRLGQYPRDAGLPDVRLDEVGPAQMVLRCHRVHGDHPVHLRVTLDASYEPAPQLSGHSGHEHDLSQDQRLPSSPRTALVLCRVPRVRQPSGLLLRCDDRPLHEVTTSSPRSTS